MLRLRPSVHSMQALVCWHHLYLFVAQHCSRTSHHSLSSPYTDPCLQVSDKGGGVPFRRIENLFSYMYSTAPAPQIGEHTRTPLVSRDTGGGVQGTAFIHSYIHWKTNKGVKILLIAPYAIWLPFCAAHKHPNAHLAFYLDSLSYLKILESFFSQKKTSNLQTQSKLDKTPCLFHCSAAACDVTENKASLNPWSPLCLCAGWLRLRSPHLSSLRQVLPGGPAALLHGGPRHRRCDLLEG